MQTMAFSFAILPGRTDAWRAFAAAVSGPRRAEWDEAHTRWGMIENWYVQRGPGGDAGIVYLSCEDIMRSFQLLAASSHPFDKWFKEQAKGVHGIDFNQVPPGPLSKLIAQSVS